jgi:RND superfamily putative drug exporter
VLVQGKHLKATDPQFQAAVADVAKRLEHTKGVTNVVTPYEPRGRGQISPDGHSTLVDFEIPGDPEDTEKLIDGSLKAVAAAAGEHPQVRVEQFGLASAQKAVEKKGAEDFSKAEVTSLPLTLVILVVAFGTLVAAGIPLLLAITGVMATLGLIGPLSQLSPVPMVINQVVLLIGLAVGVDYALFYLRRVREERAAGRSTEAAIEAAAATSGRAVLVSGITVMIAMAGMYLAGTTMFTSFATGTILVVAVSVIGSLTVLPAVLSKLGDRVDRGRVPLLGRLRGRIGEAALWSRIVDRVLRRPLLSALLSGGLLVALALPTLGMHTATPGIESISRDIPVVQTYDRIQTAFPSESVPVKVVVEADDVTAPAVSRGIDELKAATAKREDLYEGAPTVEVSPDKSVAAISIPSVGNGTDADSNRALDELREHLVPATLGATAGVDVNVTGEAAGTRDFNDTMKSNLVYVFGFVLSTAFLLLMLTFRSIVIPIKAILLNLLSVAAAYGLLVLVFQHSWAEGLLGFESNGAIASWLPLFMFVVLFGLSMDYHVFILTRIREAFDAGMTTDEAVSHGVKSTAGVVTSAAVVMVGVFSIFATLSALELKQMGVGLGAAILIDATIVRGVLLPASMKLLGDLNWWMPRSLSWLPRVSREDEEVMPAKA